MTDVTGTNDKLTTEDAAAPIPVVAPASGHDATLAERLIAQDLAVPGDGVAHSPAETDVAPVSVAEPALPKVFPYDLESPELTRAFLDARTPSAWTDRPIDEETYRHLYDLVKLGPTSANTSPLRLVFVRSPEAKERLRTALTPANVEAVMTAPVAVIVAFDPSFYDFLARLYPQADARPWFAWNDDFSQETAMRNGSLQGGYLIMAARLLGLDCWPMSGFDNARVDALFLDGRGWRSNFLLCLGYAEPAKTARNSRLMFEETCEII